MYDPRDIVLPAHRTLDLDARPWWHRAALEGKPAIADPEMAKFRSEGFRVPPQSDAQLAHMMANYFGMISLLDDQVGRLLAALEKGGLAGDTLIVFTSDHGDMLGDHGLYLKGPMAYDGVLRVGLVMAGPGIPAATAIEAPVSTIDLAATFYDSAGIAHAESQSHSLLDVIDGRRDPAAAWSEWHVHRSRLGVDLKLRTVRTARYSCSFELNSGSGELYDMQEDPDQLVNRFDDPAYGPLREELRGLMLARPGLLRERLSEPVGMA